MLKGNTCRPCPASTFRPDEAHRGLACQAWGACAVPLQYEGAAPSATADRTCFTTTICNDTQFEVSAPTAVTDRECTARRVCMAGHRVATPATETADRACAVCVAGFDFQSTANQPACTPLSSCGRDQYARVAGSIYANVVCVPCGAGHVQPLQNHRKPSCVATTTTTTTTATTTTSTSASTSSSTTQSTATTTTTSQSTATTTSAPTSASTFTTSSTTQSTATTTTTSQSAATTAATSTPERAGVAVCSLVYTALDLSGMAPVQQLAVKREAVSAANAVLESWNITGRFVGAMLQQGSLLVVLEAGAGSSHTKVCRFVAAINETVGTAPAALAIGASRTPPHRLNSPHLCTRTPPAQTSPAAVTLPRGDGEHEVGGEKNRTSTSSSWLLAAVVLLVLLAAATLVVISYKKTWIIYSADITPPPSLDARRFHPTEQKGRPGTARASPPHFKNIEGDPDVIDLFTTQQSFESQCSGGAGRAGNAASPAPQYFFGAAPGDVDVDTSETTTPAAYAQAAGQPVHHSQAAVDAGGLRLEQPAHYFQAAVGTADVDQQPAHYFQAAVDTVDIDFDAAAANGGRPRLDLTRGKIAGGATPQSVYDVAADHPVDGFGAADPPRTAAATYDVAARLWGAGAIGTPTGDVSAAHDAAAKPPGAAATYAAATPTGDVATTCDFAALDWGTARNESRAPGQRARRRESGSYLVPYAAASDVHVPAGAEGRHPRQLASAGAVPEPPPSPYLVPVAHSRTGPGAASIYEQHQYEVVPGDDLYVPPASYSVRSRSSSSLHAAAAGEVGSSSLAGLLGSSGDARDGDGAKDPYSDSYSAAMLQGKRAGRTGEAGFGGEADARGLPGVTRLSQQASMSLGGEADVRGLPGMLLLQQASSASEVERVWSDWSDEAMACGRQTSDV